MSEARGQLLEELRPAAFAIAYRMLGSVAEAEDVVQEALLRLHRALRGGRADRVAARVRGDGGHAPGDRPAALGARAPRDATWASGCPSRSSTDPEDDPARQAEMADSLSLAFLVLLESLSPEQRAVLLLRDVFDYGYDEIAEIVGKSEANVRQLAVAGAPARRGAAAALRRLARAARASWPAASSPPRRRATSAALEALLAEDVVLHGDGGGKAPALARARSRPRARRADAAAPGCEPGARIGGADPRRSTVNGQPGAMMLDGDGRVISVMALDIADGQVQGVRSIVNPDKLRHLGEVADVRALLRGES